MKVSRNNCAHCIWNDPAHKTLPNGDIKLPGCRFHNEPYLTLFWKKDTISCSHWEQYKYQWEPIE